jgi:hypothetical protein
MTRNKLAERIINTGKTISKRQTIEQEWYDCMIVVVTVVIE